MSKVKIRFLTLSLNTQIYQAFSEIVVLQGAWCFHQHILFKMDFFSILARKETVKEKMLREEERILESVAETKGNNIYTVNPTFEL